MPPRSKAARLAHRCAALYNLALGMEGDPAAELSITDILSWCAMDVSARAEGAVAAAAAEANPENATVPTVMEVHRRKHQLVSSSMPLRKKSQVRASPAWPLPGTVPQQPQQLPTHFGKYGEIDFAEAWTIADRGRPEKKEAAIEDVLPLEKPKTKRLFRELQAVKAFPKQCVGTRIGRAPSRSPSPPSLEAAAAVVAQRLLQGEDAREAPTGGSRSGQPRTAGWLSAGWCPTEG
jgi:hypothetical protein